MFVRSTFNFFYIPYRSLSIHIFDKNCPYASKFCVTHFSKYFPSSLASSVCASLSFASDDFKLSSNFLTLCCSSVSRKLSDLGVTVDIGAAFSMAFSGVPSASTWIIYRYINRYMYKMTFRFNEFKQPKRIMQ